jgi:DNA-binding helix-hairpin-helix protein with protein kinase domain
MSDGAEYVKYVLERLVRRWEEPMSREAKLELKRRREPWAVRWFGNTLSAGLIIWLSGLRRSARFRRQEANTGANRMPDYS